MTSRDFCYWLQGFFELSCGNAGLLNAVQTNLIQKHLHMVFAHEIDPSFGDTTKQQLLSEIHDPKTQKPETPQTTSPQSTPASCLPYDPFGPKIKC